MTLKLNDEFLDRLKIDWRFEFRVVIRRLRLFPTLISKIKWLKVWTTLKSECITVATYKISSIIVSCKYLFRNKTLVSCCKNLIIRWHTKSTFSTFFGTKIKINIGSVFHSDSIREKILFLELMLTLDDIQNMRDLNFTMVCR